MRHKTLFFCHVCWYAADQKRLIISHKDAAFIYWGFRNWKDDTVSMSRHESSDCHKEAVQGMIVRPQTVRDIGEQLSEMHSRENKRQQATAIENSPKHFIPDSPKYFNDESESNLVQVLKLRGNDDSRVQQWLE